MYCALFFTATRSWLSQYVKLIHVRAMPFCVGGRVEAGLGSSRIHDLVRGNRGTAHPSLGRTPDSYHAGRLAILILVAMIRLIATARPFCWICFFTPLYLSMSPFDPDSRVALHNLPGPL